MARSDEAQAFFDAVYAAIQEIPYGRVTTYGHIAALIGTPERPRQVGACLKHLPSNPDLEFNSDTVPWQRVINSKGTVSPRSHPSGARNQAAALEAEGIEVTTSALGEHCVDLAKYGWFPSELPSESALPNTAQETSEEVNNQDAVDEDDLHDDDDDDDDEDEGDETAGNLRPRRR